MGLFYAEGTGSKKTNGSKLIEVAKGEMRINKDGARLLAKLPQGRPTNLCFIFGNARSGKSFMMNCLAGRRGLFKVANSSEPCTQGVDISSHFAQHSDLAQITGTESSAANPMVGFVDVEGQGAEGTTYDTLLALPLLLTGKVVLFNHKGAPTVNDMLTKLAVLARAADYVELEDEENGGDDDDDDDDEDDEDDDDDDEEEDDVATGMPSGKARKFGHLHVLFRDFSFEGTEQSVLDQLMKKEKVPKKPKGKNLKKQVALSERQAVVDRNNIRKMLTNNFKSIRVWLFAQPAGGDELLEHSELPEKLVHPKFTATVHELLTTVTTQLKDPATFNGSALTGERLQHLLTQIVDACNKQDSINVPSAYRAMEQASVDKVFAHCLTQFQQQVKVVREQLPADVDKLKTILQESSDAMVKLFTKALADCKLDNVKELKDKALKQEAVKVTEEVLAENEVEVSRAIQKAAHEAFEEARGEFTAFVDSEALHAPESLAEKIRLLKVKASAEMDESMASLQPAVKRRPEYVEVLSHSQRAFDEFAQLKATQNTSKLKDQEIASLTESLNAQKSALQLHLDKERAAALGLQQKLQSLIDPKAGGFLEKRGRFNKNFQARWFIIDPETMTLKYFKGASDVKPKGVIPLSGCTVDSLAEGDPDFGTHGERCFQLTLAAVEKQPLKDKIKAQLGQGTDRSFKLKARTVDERDAWMKELSELIDSQSWAEARKAAELDAK